MTINNVIVDVSKGSFKGIMLGFNRRKEKVDTKNCRLYLSVKSSILYTIHCFICIVIVYKYTHMYIHIYIGSLSIYTYIPIYL